MAPRNRNNGQGYAPKLARPASLDRLRSKKAYRVFHEVVLDNEKALALEETKDAYDKTKAAYEAARVRHLNYPVNKDAEIAVQEAQAALAVAIAVHDEAREAAADEVFTFVFKGVPEHVEDQIKRACPVTDADVAKWEADGTPEDQRPDYSPISYSIAYIVAAMVEPVMTEEEFRAEIWDNEDDWNEAEKVGLLIAARSANNRATVTLGKPFGGTLPAVPSKASATDSASPAPSS